MGRNILVLVIWLNVMVGVAGNNCDNCDSCSGNRCARCLNGYFLINGYCSLCRRACITCTSWDKCYSCKEGYYLDNNYCKQCSRNCVMCTLHHGCYGCTKGYYIDNGNCKQCPSNCMTCTSRDKCNSCKEGYYGNSCRSHCDTNCNSIACYQASGTCVDGCSTGYYPSGSRCLRCSDYNCEICKDSTHCIKCTSGYYLDYNTCKGCPSGKWGYQCMNSCSINCYDTNVNDICYSEKGRCVYGCKPGYQGPKCDSVLIPVHGQWGQWSEYGQCFGTCGLGRRTRLRSCNDPSPQNGGKYCDGSETDFTSCQLLNCPVDRQWSTWSEYGPCSVTCGQGLKSRNRSCDQPAPQNDGQLCNGNDEETTVCNLTICPGDGQWGDWSDFGNCSVTCGLGSRIRSRECAQPSPQNGGQNCSGNNTETIDCKIDSCPVDGGWGQWSEFTPCSETCGKGHKRRKRSCDNPVPQSGGIECVGEKYYTVDCEQLNCSSIGQTGADSSDSGALVGGIAGGVALFVVAGVMLAVLYKFRKARQNNMQDISAHRTAVTQGIELDPEQYEELTERPPQNATYMELNTTKHESVDEQPRRAKQQHIQDHSVNQHAATQEIEHDPVQYEVLTERPHQNATYMKLNTTEYESVDEQPRRYSGSEIENTEYQNVSKVYKFNK